LFGGVQAGIQASDIGFIRIRGFNYPPIGLLYGKIGVMSVMLAGS
jgi:hypothetical protein